MVHQEKFSKYIDFSRSILRALPAAEVPRDLMDADMFVTTCDMYDGFYDQLGEDDFKDAIGAASGKAEVMDASNLIGGARYTVRVFF